MLERAIGSCFFFLIYIKIFLHSFTVTEWQEDGRVWGMGGQENRCFLD